MGEQPPIFGLYLLWPNEIECLWVVAMATNFGTKNARGVTTAGDTGDASPVRPTMSPYIKITTDSLSSELTFDE